MTAVWDSTLPQSLHVSGFSEGIGDGLTEYQPDTGPSITRLRSSAVVRPLTGYMIVTDTQLVTFRTFFITTLLRGALPFSFPDQVEAGTLLVKFTKQNPPNWLSLGVNNYQLNLSLMVLP